MALMLPLLAFIFATLLVAAIGIRFAGNRGNAMDRRLADVIGRAEQADESPRFVALKEAVRKFGSKVPVSPKDVGKVRLRLNEGLTGWVARERRLLAISREAYRDSRFKYFGDLPEDTYEAFLSAPVIARNRVVGVINVQHRSTHQHTGNEMEVLTTVGEQVGCLLVLARMEPTAVAAANHVQLVLSSGPAQHPKRQS